MRIEALLHQLSKQYVELWLEGDKLGFRLPKSTASSDIMVQLKQYKQQIIDHLFYAFGFSWSSYSVLLASFS